jgi:flagellar motor protein MotB
MNAVPAFARGLALAAFAAAALGSAGCRTSCRPPCDMAERPPCGCPPPVASCPAPRPAPAPAPCAPPAPPAAAPCAPPAPPPPAPVAARSQETIDAYKLQIEAQRKEMARLEEERKTQEAALEEAKRHKLEGEQAAQSLAEEMKGLPGATVLVEGSKVSVIVTDCFDSGSDRLKPNPDVRTALRAASAAILRHPEAQVVVVGHTDSKPIQKSAEKWADNVALSKARAASVAKALSTDGVQAERLGVDGRGSAEMLVVPEKTAADRARNRRVEVQFTFPG